MPPKKKITQKQPATKKSTPRRPTGKKATPKMPVSSDKQSNKRKDESSSNDNEVEKTTAHLKREDYLIIINWLLIEQNYDSCFRSGKAPPDGKPFKVKIDGYEIMSINLWKQSPKKIKLKARQMKDGFKTYKDNYKKENTKYLLTGFGLNPHD